MSEQYIDTINVGGTNYNVSDEKQKISSSDDKMYLTGVTTAPTSTEVAYKGVANKQVYAENGSVYSENSILSPYVVVPDSPWLERPTGDSNTEVATGLASVQAVGGNGVAWNQMATPATASVDKDNSEGTSAKYYNTGISVRNYINEHKYYGKTLFFTSNNDPDAIGSAYLNDSVQQNTLNGIIFIGNNQYQGNPSLFIRVPAGKNAQGSICAVFIDLTLLGIDNLTTTAEVEAWLAMHVGTKPYYPQNNGTLLPAKLQGYKTTGKSANLLNPTTRTARLFAYTWPDHNNMFTIKELPSDLTLTFTPDATGVAETITPDSNGHFSVSGSGNLVVSGSADLSATWLIATWDESMDNYDNFEAWDGKEYAFDVTKVYGKRNGAGDYVQVFQNGLRGAGTAKDVLDLTNAAAVVNIGSVDMGTIEFGYVEQNQDFASSALKNIAAGKILCPRYATQSSPIHSTIRNMAIGFNPANRILYVKDTNYSDEEQFKASLNGVPLWYNLATPAHYTDCVYRDNGVDTPLSELNILVNNWAYEQAVVAQQADEFDTTKAYAKGEYVTYSGTQYRFTAAKTAGAWDSTKVTADASPVSCASMTTIDYSIDIKENINTLLHIKADEEDLAKKANTYGHYPNLHVGMADTLVGDEFDNTDTYIIRPTAGNENGVDNEIENGTAELVKVQGNGLAWNVEFNDDDFVDMGLPSGTLWAKCNIDVNQPRGLAASPFQYDCSFFSWGNIDGHNPTSVSSFSPWNWGSVNEQEPWYEGQPYGNTNGNTLTGNIPVGEEFDAARANLGAPWRMPTNAEYGELFANIRYINADGSEIPVSQTDKRVTVNGVVGLYLESTINGARLFFSASGYGAGTSRGDRGSYGFYWSATWYSARGARSLFFYSGRVNPSYNVNRCHGFAVRAVSSKGLITGLNNHKYLVTDRLISDASLMFGLGNEQGAEAKVTSLIPQKPNYSLNTGELYGVKKLHIVSYGQNLLNPANGQARLAPYNYGSGEFSQYGILARNGASISAVTFTSDATGVAEAISPNNTTGIFSISGKGAGTLNVTMASGSSASDVYVWAVYDGAKDGIENYVPFQQDAIEIKASEVYGKLNGEGEYVKVFADDVMRKCPAGVDVCSLIDKTADVLVGEHDLGDIPASSWFNRSGMWQGVNNWLPKAESTSVYTLLSSKYPSATGLAVYAKNTAAISAGSDALYVGVLLYDPNFVEYTAEQLSAAVSGTKVWHKLATPSHYTDLKLSSDGGETFRELPKSFAVDNWGIEEQIPSETIPEGKDFEGISARVTATYQRNVTEQIGSLPASYATLATLKGKADKVLNSTAGNIAILTGDGNYADGGMALTAFGASGDNHSIGLVPDPGSTAGTSKYLCEDGSWKLVSTTDTTYKLTVNGTVNGDLSGTNLGTIYAPSSAGTSGQYLKSSGSGEPTWSNLPTVSTANAGIVASLPTSSATSKYLRGDNTWVTPTNTTYSAGSNISITGNNNAINALGYSWDSTNSIMSVTGQVNASSGFFLTSDIRKKNILGDLDLNKAYELVDKCQTILYTLKDNPKEDIGLIAQEVQEYFPEIVNTDLNGYLSLDYAKLTVIILKVLKDLISRIEKLEVYGLGN